MTVKAKLFGLIPREVDVDVRYVATIEKRPMNNGTEGEVAGRAYGSYVVLLESERGNPGLLNHELEHCRQMIVMTKAIHKFLRSISKSYSAWAEACAYAVQLMTYGRDDQYYEERLKAYAYLMAYGYTFRMSEDEARRRILEKC